MCIIERKTYVHSNGNQHTVETPRLCARAIGSRLCNRVERRSVEVARIVERRPSSSTTTPSEGVIVTEGRDGRTRVYRDLSHRSSNSSSIRRSTTMSDRSPTSTPSSASSPLAPSYVEVKPEAPSPPPAAPGFPFQERTRAPYPPPLSPPDPDTVITPGGHAIYDRPPSLELPRANDNERRIPTRRERRVSFSSTVAEVDDIEQPGPSRQPGSSRPRRTTSITIDTNVRPPTSSSSSRVRSPDRNRLPRTGSLRRDSGLPRRDSYRTERRRPNDDGRRPDNDRQYRSDPERLRRRESEERRLRDEDARQAERRRDDIAAETARERRRQETLAALEGQQGQQQAPNQFTQRNIDAEFAQMAREREAAAARQRDSDILAQRYAEDQLLRDAEAMAQYQAARPGPYSARRRMTADRDSGPYIPSPLSARSPVAVHQYPSARRRGSSIRERGEEVIAREQVRLANERSAGAMGGLGIDDFYGEEYGIEDDYVGEGQERRRRRRREGERDARYR